jgi:putative ABC transport system permease protein
MSRLLPPWYCRIAWRDARRNLLKLTLALSCVVIGVACIVAAMSFRENLTASTREQSKSLLGADLALEGREPFSPEAEALIRSIGGDQSREIAFSSMAFFPNTGAARLVQVRAIGGNFPYYGKLETEPAAARDQFQSGSNALVDETLMLQFNIHPGQSIKIGDQDFRIAGKLRKIPGESIAFSLINPRVYVPLNALDRTPLLQRGSLVRYRVLFKLNPRVDVDRLVQNMAPQLEQLRLQFDTVQRRATAVSRAMENLARYLGLAVFIAVLLAGVGIASGVHVYAKEKTVSVALLRCVGAQAAETVWVYVIQILAVALAGSCIGAALGIGLQALLPLALKDFLPVTASLGLPATAVLSGIGVGLSTGVLFALLPLLSLRKISPLLVLRFAYEEMRPHSDPWAWTIGVLLVTAILAFAAALTERRVHAVWFTAGVIIAFALLALAARVTSAIVKHVAAKSLPFSWRQGLANVHRPNNQTMAVMLALGLGTFLLVTQFNIQKTLLDEVARKGGSNEPNLVFFDIQTSQRSAVRDLIHSFNVTIREEVPVITVRLAAVKDRGVEELRNDPSQTIPRWALRREYRVTYRSGLGPAERVIAGTWRPRVHSQTEVIPISLEKSIAETLRVGIGDRLQFDLQGVSLVTEVSSIREVDWQRLEPNFFVTFPEGVLEQAPQFYAFVMRTDSGERSALLQRAAVERFPNVAMIDLTLILNTLDTILGRISAAVRFVAAFILLAGLFVLGSAILSRRSQRLRESILLKTLGAPRRQIVTIIAAEYLFLGAIACLAGLILGAVASWALSFYFLGITFSFSAGPAVVIIALTIGATAAFGILGCWGIFSRSPLEALRAES